MKNQDNQILISTQVAYHIVSISDVLYCVSDNSYTTFHLKDKSVIKVSLSIKKLESILTSYSFVRPHQSYLVNSQYIKEITKNHSSHILLSNNAIIPVSIRRKKSLMQLLSNIHHIQIVT